MLSGASFKLILAFILIWIIVAGLGWISFQLWWDRKDKVSTSSDEKDQFVATPVFSHFIQTMGEWLCVWIGIGGCLILVFTRFLAEQFRALASIANNTRKG